MAGLIFCRIIIQSKPAFLNLRSLDPKAFNSVQSSPDQRSDQKQAFYQAVHTSTASLTGCIPVELDLELQWACT